MLLGLRTEAPAAPVIPAPGICDIVESALHLVALLKMKADPERRARTARKGRPPVIGTEVQDALDILVSQCEDSGHLARYLRQLGEMP